MGRHDGRGFDACQRDRDQRRFNGAGHPFQSDRLAELRDRVEVNSLQARLAPPL